MRHDERPRGAAPSICPPFSLPFISLRKAWHRSVIYISHAPAEKAKRLIVQEATWRTCKVLHEINAGKITAITGGARLGNGRGVPTTPGLRLWPNKNVILVKSGGKAEGGSE